MSDDREAGFGFVGIAVSLLIVALLSLGAMALLGGNGGGAAGSAAQSPEVARAYDVQAQSALDSVTQNVRDAGVADGGLGSIDLSQFGVTSAPSSGPQSVSGVTGPAGVTLAVHSQSGTCWFAFVTASATWYGAEPDASSCAPVALTAPPVAGPAGSGTIGWQMGSFPVA